MAGKEIIILGAIGNTARQNRDNMRVLDRRGQLLVKGAYRQRSSADCEEKRTK